MKELTPEEISKIWEERAWRPTYLFLDYPLPRSFVMPQFTEAQKENFRKASDLIGKYVSKYKVEIVWERHNPIVSDEMRKKLGLDNDKQK